MHTLGLKAYYIYGLISFKFYGIKHIGNKSWDKYALSESKLNSDF